MNQQQRKKGKTQMLKYRDRYLSITDILKESGVSDYIQRKGSLTYGSQRNRVRLENTLGTFTKEAVEEFLQQRQNQRQRNVAKVTGPRRGQLFSFNGNNYTLTEILENNLGIRRAYEARGINTPLAQRNRHRKDLVEGRNPLALPSQRGTIIIRGEWFTARGALERYPQLNNHLRGRNEKALLADLRRKFKDGKITDEMLGLDSPTIMLRKGETLRDGRIVNHYTINVTTNTSPLDYLNYIRGSVVTFLDNNRQNKVGLNLVCEMIKVDHATGEIIDTDDRATFRSNLESVFGTTDLVILYEKMTGKILESFATYLKNGSGWILKSVVRAEITLARLRPLRGSSYMELPKSIRKKQAIINMKNKDDVYCFKWANTRAQNPVDGKHGKPERVTKELRKQAEELNFDGIEFPTPCSERMFKKFEKNNKINVSVFGYVPNSKKCKTGFTIIPL